MNLPALYRNIASDAYHEEYFNLGENPQNKDEKIRPPFSVFLDELDKQVMNYKYDAVINRTRKSRESDPSGLQQKEYMVERLP